METRFKRRRCLCVSSKSLADFLTHPERRSQSSRELVDASEH
jgi:hypothetical protein